MTITPAPEVGCYRRHHWLLRALGSAAFNSTRYAWVKKKMERSDVVAGTTETIVYNLGTLYGAWPDGTPFEGNRYVDRFVVRAGLIVDMQVWNDSAERILSRRAIAE